MIYDLCNSGIMDQSSVTLARTKSRQDGDLDPFLSAANIGRVGV